MTLDRPQQLGIREKKVKSNEQQHEENHHTLPGKKKMMRPLKSPVLTMRVSAGFPNICTNIGQIS
jgi:hypothetical protein